jgi:hypothetical protein
LKITLSPFYRGSLEKKINLKGRYSKMKKIFFMTMTMVFALTLGLAYAGNGVTDFSGRSYDTLGPGPAGKIAHAGSGAGEAVAALHNGVTDFTGRSYDTLELAQNREIAQMEGSAAGSMRADESKKGLFNGVSDFTGRSYDSL